MNKVLRFILLLALVVSPIIFYKTFNRKKISSAPDILSPFVLKNTKNRKQNLPSKGKIALIFDALGERFSDLKKIYEINIPVSVSVIPHLKFSRNIAHIAKRCGFSVLIHLLLESEQNYNLAASKYQLISSSMSDRKLQFYLRHYLNSIRIASGVNMGSKTTEDKELMRKILKVVKKNKLFFIDSRTSLNSVAYEVARKLNLKCAQSSGFLDSVDNKEKIAKKMKKFIILARKKGKIIIIAHPKKNTLSFLKENIAQIKKEVKFITLEEYFNI